MYLNNTKALTKVTKDHQKKPKSLFATIIFNRLTSYNQWRELIQKSLSVLIRVLHVTISFNDTGFCSMLATILPRCKTNPNSPTISRIEAFWHKIQSTMTKTKYTIRFVSKDSSPPKKKNQINILSRFPGFPKCHRQIFKRKHISPLTDHSQTMFRASASITGSINIWLSTLLSTCALSIRFRFKKLRVTN